MGRTVLTVVGVVLAVVGGVFTFQGLGYLKGSPMTGVDTWAIVGPVIAGLGVALIYTGYANSRR